VHKLGCVLYSCCSCVGARGCIWSGALVAAAALAIRDYIDQPACTFPHVQAHTLYIDKDADIRYVLNPVVVQDSSAMHRSMALWMHATKSQDVGRVAGSFC
jgi:hypothetical protein